MPLTLVAPVTEADYRAHPALPLPESFSGDTAIALLNQAWAFLTNWANQPLTKTTTTEDYPFGTRNCNMTPEGYLNLNPRFGPIISVTSVTYSLDGLTGWTPCTRFYALRDNIRVYDAPFARGDVGIVKVSYSSGIDPISDDLKLACFWAVSLINAAGFLPTQAGIESNPAWLNDDLRNTYFNLRRVMEIYKRRS